jgi:hypothetical protein
MKRVLYFVLTLVFVLVAFGIELQQRLHGHPFSFAQLALDSIHHEQLIVGSILIGIFFLVKFVGTD